MISGSTADRLGRRRTFVIGLCTFAAGSLLCSLAPNLGTLIVFRMVQAVGGSMLNPVAMSIITNTFTIPRERAQADRGLGARWSGVSMALGPVVGGVLVTSVGWRSIFWINIPIALAAVVLALRYIPESKAPVARKVDVPGQMLVIALLASLTYGIIEAPDRGWSSTVIVGAFAVAAVSLVAFLIWERRAVEPLIDLRFFRSVPFSSATVIAVAAFAALGGFLFLNTLYLQDVRGLSRAAGRDRHVAHGGDDHALLADLGADRRPARRPDSPPRRRRRPHGLLSDAGRTECHDTVHLVVHGLRDLRHRVRLRERADHQRRRLGHAAGPGRCRRGHRQHVAPDRVDTGRRGGRDRSSRPRCRRAATSTSPSPAAPGGGSWPAAALWC